MIINKRRKLAYNLRNKGLTFKAIGKIMNVTGGRAQQIFRAAERRIKDNKKWESPLSIRAQQVIFNNFQPSCREDLKALVVAGEFSNQKKHWRSLGKKTIQEIYKFVGLKAPVLFKSICPVCQKIHSCIK